MSHQSTEVQSKKLEIGMLKCSRCKSFIRTKHFHRDSNRATGFSEMCKSCTKVAPRDLKEKKERNQKMLEYRNRLKKAIVELAGGQCQRCGYDEFLGGFCFHHINPANKEYAFITRVSTEKAKVEADKCILLCHTCHKTFHYGDWSAEFVKRDGIGWTI